MSVIMCSLDKLYTKPNDSLMSAGKLVSLSLTIWWELILLKHSDAQDILVEVFDKKLAVEVPLGVQSVADGPGRVALSPHRQLTVRIILTWGEMMYLFSLIET